MLPERGNLTAGDVEEYSGENGQRLDGLSRQSRGIVRSLISFMPTAQHSE
jgi:hypothetical protein